ncbi:MAG: Rpn family recombination-promoting nuclease/putative transposase [Spirulinaceae cyanobacterium]
MNFINPKTDYAFKKIFGSEQSKDILISFLNALVYGGEPTIEDLEIINPHLAGKVEGLKDTYLDVQAKLNDGSLIIIEMQVLNVESFTKRVLYNAAKTYSLQLKSGQGYRDLKPVIALTITDFKMFSEFEEIISRFRFQEVKTNIDYPSNHIELIFVELPKFAQEQEDLATITDKWIYFLKSANALNSVPDNLGSVPAINKAFQIANQTNLSRDELEELEKRELFIYDQQGAIRLAKREGIEEGMEQGKKQKAIEIARQLLEVFDDSQIAETTGLTVAEVRELR